MADTLIQADIPVDASQLYRLGNKIVHPMTLSENDNNRYLVFKIDFDGANPLFIESQHRLDIAVAKEQDVTIPLLVDYPTDIPQDISQLSFAVFAQHQYYQFAMDVNAQSVIAVETPDMTAGNIEITIANRAPGVLEPVWKSDPNSQTGKINGWYFEEATLAVIQIKVPIGLTGTVTLGQCKINEPYMGYTVAENGTLTIDPTSTTMYIADRGTNEDRLIFGKPSQANKPIVQLFNEISIGQAIAAKRVENIYFAQGISEVRHWKAEGSNFLHRNGTSGAWLWADLISNKAFVTNLNAAHQNITFPEADLDLYERYAVFEFVSGGINAHYYDLDSNLVPLSYLGHSFIPWTYDETKPISVLSQGGVAALGTAYNVSPGDLGPLRTDFVMSHNYEVVVTDVTEV